MVSERESFIERRTSSEVADTAESSERGLSAGQVYVQHRSGGYLSIYILMLRYSTFEQPGS